MTLFAFQFIQLFCLNFFVGNKQRYLEVNGLLEYGFSFPSIINQFSYC